MLNMLDGPVGLGNDDPAITSISSDNKDVYQELAQRTMPENTYYALDVKGTSGASNEGNVDTETAYQNTTVCIEA